MKIGFDVSQTGRAKTGCGYFSDSLARQLLEIDPVNTYLLYPTFGPGYWDPEWPARTLNPFGWPNARRGLGHRRLDQLEAFWLEPPPDFEARLGSPDVIHANNFFCPVGLQRARLVYTLHDLAFLEHPEWTTEANWRTCFEGVFHASVYADHIVAVSRSTRDHFLATFPHYPAERLSVVYEASRFAGPARGPQPETLAQLQPGAFWLTVGTPEPRKNHLRLLEAYAQLRARHETTDPLVLVGGGGWLTDALQQRIEALGLVSAVLQLGYVDDAQLQWLYEHCTALCYPSRFEGFGLPVIEAMSLGAAVVTSNVTALPEVVGDAGLLVDPLDVESIYAGLRQLATSVELRRQLGARALARAGAFTWQHTATDVLELYHRVISERAHALERKVVVGAVEA